MYKIAIAIVLCVAGFSTEGRSEELARGRLAIDSYLCGQFSADVSRPNNAQKFVRVLMMISWAAGYAAAHEKEGVGAGKIKLELVSSALKMICHDKPTELAMSAFVAETKRFIDANQLR